MWQRSHPVSESKGIILFPKCKVVIDGREIAYTDNQGKGPLVFCIPPWPSSSVVFTPLMSALKDDFRIIALDLPGWGGDSSQMTEKPTMENYATIVEKFIQHFKPKKFSLLGYSFGGLIAQIIISRGKLKPEKLVFVSTLHSGKRIKERQKPLLFLYQVLRALNVRPILIKKGLALLTLINGQGTWYFQAYKDTKVFKEFLRDDLKFNIITIVETLFTTLNEDWLPDFNRNTSALVIHADTDPPFIKEESREIAAALGIEPMVLENTDHNHLTFDANKCADIILNFLTL